MGYWLFVLGGWGIALVINAAMDSQSIKRYRRRVASLEVYTETQEELIELLQTRLSAYDEYLERLGESMPEGRL